MKEVFRALSLVFLIATLANAAEAASAKPLPKAKPAKPTVKKPKPAAVVAEDDESEDEDEEDDSDDTGPIAANLAFVTDYYSHGISQTRHQPAVQGGFDYAHDSGLRLGVWGSNVQFPDSTPNLELDLGVGFGHEFRPGLEATLMFTHVNYYENDGRDAWVVPFEVKTGPFTFTAEYSPKFEGLSAHAWYVSAAWNAEVGPGIQLGALAGYSFFPEGSSLPNYPHFQAKIGYDFLGLDWTLTGEFVRDMVVDSLANEDEDEDTYEETEIHTGSRAIFGVSKTF